MVPQDLIDKYRWVKELRDGWDVTVIAGRSSAEVIRICGLGDRARQSVIATPRTPVGTAGGAKAPRSGKQTNAPV